MHRILTIIFICMYQMSFMAGCHVGDLSRNQIPELTNAIEINKKAPGIFVLLQCPKKNKSFVKYFGYRNAFVIPNDESIGWLDTKDCGDITTNAKFGFFACDWKLQETFRNLATKHHSSGTLKENESMIVPGADSDWLWVELTASSRE